METSPFRVIERWPEGFPSFCAIEGGGSKIKDSEGQKDIFKILKK